MRFIEFMPLDADGHWVNDQVVGQDEIVETINAVYPIEQMPARGRRRPTGSATSTAAARSA